MVTFDEYLAMTKEDEIRERENELTQEIRKQNAKDLKKAFRRFLEAQDKKRKRGGND